MMLPLFVILLCILAISIPAGIILSIINFIQTQELKKRLQFLEKDIVQRRERIAHLEQKAVSLKKASALDEIISQTINVPSEEASPVLVITEHLQNKFEKSEELTDAPQNDILSLNIGSSDTDIFTSEETTSTSALAISPKAQEENTAPSRSIPYDEVISADGFDPQSDLSNLSAEPIISKTENFINLSKQEEPSSIFLDNPKKEEPSRKEFGSIETLLGARWSIWIGGIAIALGGLFLVRYSIEQGYLGPAVRVALGILLGTLLVLAGEFVRRRDITKEIPGFNNAHIPSVLTASGTTVLFGAVYAAHAFYHFIGTGTALFSLGIIAVATLFASAIHGPALAGLGLVGAMGAPLLVNSTGSSKISLVIYLAVVAASAFVLTNWRKWHWLGWSNVAAAFLWGLILHNIDPDASLYHSTIQTLLAVTALLLCAPRGWSERRIALLSCLSIGILAILNIPTHLFSEFQWISVSQFISTNQFLTFLMFNCAIIFFGAVLRPRGASLLALSVILAFIFFWAWPSTDGSMHILLSHKGAEFKIPGPLSNLTLYTLWLSLFIVCLIAFPNIRLLFPKYKYYIAMSPAQVLSYALTSTFGVAFLLSIGGTRIWLTFSSPWALSIFSFIGVTLFTSLVYLFVRVGATKHQNGRLIIEVFCIAAVTCLAFFLARTFAYGWMTVSFSIAALILAFISTRFVTRTLPTAIGLSSLVVLGRLWSNPLVMEQGVGQIPFFNWVLLGYAVPAIGYAAAWYLMDRKGMNNWGMRMSLCMSIVLAALFATFELRHFLYDGNLFAQKTSLVEQGLLVTLAMAFSLAMAAFSNKNITPIFRRGEVIFTFIGFCQTLIALLGFYNPLFSGETVVGIPFLNSLSLGYLIPSLMTAAAITFYHKGRSKYITFLLGWQALLLFFIFCLLNLRFILYPDIHISSGLSLSGAGLSAVLTILFAAGSYIWIQRFPISYPRFATLFFTGLTACYTVIQILRAIALMMPFHASSLNSYETSASGNPVILVLITALVLPAACATGFNFLYSRYSDKKSIIQDILGWCGLLLMYTFIILISRYLQFGFGTSISFSKGYILTTCGIAATGALLIFWWLSVMEKTHVPIRLSRFVFLSGGITLALSGMASTLNPLFNSSEFITGWLFPNSLLISYLLPGLAVILLSEKTHYLHDLPEWLQALTRWTGTFLVFLFLVLQFRCLQLGSLNIHNSDNYLMLTSGIAATFALIVSSLQVAYDPSHSRTHDFPYNAASFLALGITLSVAGAGILFNPFFNISEKISGGIFINTLLPTFMIPILTLLCISLKTWKKNGQVWTYAIGTTITLLTFIYLTLSVRWGYNGENLQWLGRPEGAERWTYSAVWLIFGFTLLVLGINRKQYSLRLFSSPFIFLTILKIFLLDMSGLSGIWRPLSFIALGLALIVIGRLYQKVLFQENFNINRTVAE